MLANWHSAFVLLLFLAARTHADEDAFFENQVRPILVKHCQNCHGAKKQSGGLRLDSRKSALQGGDRGPAIIPGQAEKGLLIEALSHRMDLRMPPKSKLEDGEISVLTKWIRDGASWPNEVMQAATVRTGAITPEERNLWSLQPVKFGIPPTVLDTAWPSCDIDRFVLRRLEEKKLKPAPDADRRTLIRRVTFDLIGLPPTPDEVDAFLTDQSPDAYSKVVNRLLASKHYGERWGRHWLDVVRYADTAGETADFPVPQAYRYRNYVIDAFNSDKPYDELIREQIAGDILAAKGPPEKYAERVTATGFIAISRRFGFDPENYFHLTIQDTIDTVGQAFLGLSLGCARCHDHKFDPVLRGDYYAMYGIFESTRYAVPGSESNKKPIDFVALTPPNERVPDPANPEKADVGQPATDPVAIGRAIQTKFQKSRQVLNTGEIADGGDKRFDSGIEPIEVRAGDLLLLSITPLKNYGADTTLVELDIAEVGGSKRTWTATADLVPDLLAGNPHADSYGNKQVWWMFDTRNQPTILREEARDFDGKQGLNVWRSGETPSVFVNAGKEELVVWTKLPPQTLFVHPAANGNVGVGWLSPIAGKVRVTGRVRDVHPGGPDGVGWILERFAIDVRAELAALAEASKRQHPEASRTLPKDDLAYAVVEGKPKNAKVQKRGEPLDLGEEVPRRWLEIFGGTPLKNQAGSGRLELAEWIASPQNPLTARVMVNRLWQHHFGAGLVSTPNDFGTRGHRPTHPELLDFLASKFVESGWSIKAMHRLIVLSRTYQLSAAASDELVSADPNNVLLGRRAVRRLDAEAIRDSMLAVSGKLDPTMGGPHPFPPASSWSFTQHAPFSALYSTNRRSVYLMTQRLKRHPFLALFDGADTNTSTPQRIPTTVPTQALFVMNDPLVHEQADAFAGRILAMSKEERDRIRLAYEFALARPPRESEYEEVGRFLKTYRERRQAVRVDAAERESWTAFMRTLFARNEFFFVQ